MDRKRVGPRGKKELGSGVERLGQAVVQGCQAVLMEALVEYAEVCFWAGLGLGFCSQVGGLAGQWGEGGDGCPTLGHLVPSSV